MALIKHERYTITLANKNKLVATYNDLTLSTGERVQDFTCVRTKKCYPCSEVIHYEKKHTHHGTLPSYSK